MRLRDEADLSQQGDPVHQDELLQLRWYQVDVSQGVPAQVHVIDVVRATGGGKELRAGPRRQVKAGESRFEMAAWKGAVPLGLRASPGMLA